MAEADKDGRIAQMLSDRLACLGMSLHEHLRDLHDQLGGLNMPTSPIPVVDVEANLEGHVITGTPEWEALVVWTDDQGIDPNHVLASDGITRDSDGIHYTTFVYGRDGRRRLAPGADGAAVFLHEQGHLKTDAPPPPFPDSVVRRMGPRPPVASRPTEHEATRRE